MEKKEGKFWSEDVETKWHAPKGFFEQSAEDIAKGLNDASDSLKQAMSRLNFYINRAGANLTEERKVILEKAKKILEQLYN